MRHIKEMKIWMPSVLKYYWYICWSFVSPALLCFITVLFWINYVPKNFEGYVYPPGAQFLGWGLELLSVTIVFIVLIFTFINRARKGKSISFRVMFLEPTPLWGARMEEQK